MQPINAEALILLKTHRSRLSPQEYKTLRGQVLAGNDTGAIKGLEKLLKRGKEMTDKGNLSMYLDFRSEIDKICVPEILLCVDTMPIYYDYKQVGMLCYVENAEGFTYIDCLYIEPNYRRKGLAKYTVNVFYDMHKGKEIRLHIINRNRVAYDFWTNLFELEEIEGNFVDTLYRIKGVRR